MTIRLLRRTNWTRLTTPPQPRPTSCFGWLGLRYKAGATTLLPVLQLVKFSVPDAQLPSPESRTPAVIIDSRERPYPANWENVAHLRVFRTSPGEWDKVAAWRAEMVKKGWKLLRVSSDAEEIVAVFGKTKLGQGAQG
jgi:hypothetical protein